MAGTQRNLTLPSEGYGNEPKSEADVLLTATYVALAEDMLTGQIDPKKVSQAWHIDREEVDVRGQGAQGGNSIFSNTEMDVKNG